eukprot:2013312-Rhodomonas_salina.3
MRSATWLGCGCHDGSSSCCCCCRRLLILAVLRSDSFLGLLRAQTHTPRVMHRTQVSFLSRDNVSQATQGPTARCRAQR